MTHRTNTPLLDTEGSILLLTKRYRKIR